MAQAGMIMSGVVVFRDIDETLGEAYTTMRRNNANAVVVMRNGIPAGILTEKHFREHAASAKASMAMSPFVSVSHDSDAAEARAKMQEHNLSHIPVVRDNEVVGLITSQDIESLFI